MPFNLRTFKLAPKIVCLKSRLFADIKTDSLVQKDSFVLFNHYSLLTFNSECFNFELRTFRRSWSFKYL